MKYLKASPVAPCLEIRRDENWKGGREVAERKNKPMISFRDMFFSNLGPEMKESDMNHHTETAWKHCIDIPQKS